MHKLITAVGTAQDLSSEQKLILWFLGKMFWFTLLLSYCWSMCSFCGVLRFKPFGKGLA